ncbi:hypothetical protein DPMN_189955 [Dreissena polymorpha]|uniref:EF-hand domain-containing protein n=1 Tax=Dreissena polymorpha TaxID=45954 RepID=A0A9D4DTB7_DREPO|nr:hypothetical protein DPMN_189955 [Dreissena polymorpha]
MLRELLLIFSLLLGTIYAKGPNSADQPDIDELIDLLYLRYDANRDGLITEAELSDVIKVFDENGDDIVNEGEFEDGWRTLTGQNLVVSNAYFHMADLNDDKIIDQKDYDIDYKVVFDLNLVPEATMTNKVVVNDPTWDLNQQSWITLDFDAGWAHLDYALQSEANSLFRFIDANGDHYITDADMDKLFAKYN